jgi:hypothetical protein
MFGISTVQVINNEVIGAGSSTRTPNVNVVFHCRIEGNGNLHFTIRSTSMDELNYLAADHLVRLSGQGAQ